ncbi:hypothetical protein [Streptomyces sp. NPDC127039]|uniref:hypothetical protein n=1 Tax=Streptomyces sp. NPDC127039 TaxID=3347115 RepID=UPI00364CF5F1
MQLFAEARSGDGHFNKLVVFDEAQKYVDSPDLVAGVVETVREMRHKGMSVLVASQDPPSVPISLIELSDHVILHKFTSPAWLKHLQKANTAFAGLRSEYMAQLQPGEAHVWASKSTDAAFTHGAVRMRCRPQVTRHGGGTKTAVGNGQTVTRPHVAQSRSPNVVPYFPPGRISPRRRRSTAARMRLS